MIITKESNLNGINLKIEVNPEAKTATGYYCEMMFNAFTMKDSTGEAVADAVKKEASKLMKEIALELSDRAREQEPEAKQEPAAAPAAGVTAEQVQTIAKKEIQGMAAKLITTIGTMLNSQQTKDALTESVKAQVLPAVMDYIAEPLQQLIKTTLAQYQEAAPKEIVIKTPEGTEKKVKGATHEKFKEITQLIYAGEPVYLYGPAGTGKSHIAKQVADALELDFYFSNCITQEYKITGFIDANGNYQETQFYKAFTQGGLFFLDEIDGSIPETLININSALANGWFDFPIGKREAHPNFRVIAAGNTLGTGADAEYTGRYQLDASTLDRFFKVNIDYSIYIEQAITGNNIKLIEFAHAWRKACTEAGINALFTYRALTRINKLEKVLSLVEVLKGTLTAALNTDDLQMIYIRLDLTGNNPYKNALHTDYTARREKEAA